MNDYLNSICEILELLVSKPNTDFYIAKEEYQIIEKNINVLYNIVGAECSFWDLDINKDRIAMIYPVLGDWAVLGKMPKNLKIKEII